MEEKIYYNSTDDITLYGKLSKVNDSKKIIILCHGLKGNVSETGSFDELTKYLKKEKINSFRFDFRGHGKSTGNDYDMTITKEVEDLEMTINMLKRKGFEEFMILGASFGASIMSLIDYDKYKEVKGLINWYGAIDYKATIEEDSFFSDEHKKIAERDGYYPIISKRTGNIFRLGLSLFKEIDVIKPYEKLIKVNLPILFVHGLADNMVPYQLSEKICSMCQNAKIKLIENGNHTFRNDDKALEDAIKETIKFIKEILQ